MNRKLSFVTRIGTRTAARGPLRSLTLVLLVACLAAAGPSSGLAAPEQPVDAGRAGGPPHKSDAPTSGMSPEEASQGFVSLFDGKTLKGWQGATAGYVPGEGGVLVCQKRGGGNIFTVKEFGDFVFRFEFRLEPGGNNGVSVRGKEIQILDDYAPKHAHLKPCQYHGSIYCTVPAKRGHTKPAGQWNSEEIECRGSHWKVTVNGAVVVDVDLAKVEGQEELARRTKGPLGFKGHGSRVEFRNLRVKELK